MIPLLLIQIGFGTTIPVLAETTRVRGLLVVTSRVKTPLVEVSQASRVKVEE